MTAGALRFSSIGAGACYTTAMSQRLVVFISSTVEDLDDVRRELKSALERREIEVRLSDEPDFPVEPGVTSHDACLRAVRASHVFVLLVGERFGGEYQGQNKSITWREWEEAMEAGILPIVLVRRDANDDAILLFRLRRQLVLVHADHSVVEIDAMLRADPRFTDEKPHRHNMPGVQRFIDALRKGHVDNWMHSDWDGTAIDALHRIDARLSTALASCRHRQWSLRDIAERERARIDSLSQLVSYAASVSSRMRSGETTMDQALAQLLARLVDQKSGLFGFRDADHYNFVVYLKDGDLLHQRARQSHPAITSYGRSWRVGQGHIGLAVEKRMLMVSGDIRNTNAWVPSDERPTDRAHYVSAVSVPFSFRTRMDDPEGALIVTSSRIDHFRSPDQVEVLTVGAVANMFSMVLSAGEALSSGENR
jgi:hypothetical protein